jgi:hypothetical protein
MIISIADLRKACTPNLISTQITSAIRPGDRDPDDNPPEPALALAA